MAARENRATHSTSDSTLAGTNRSEGTGSRSALHRHPATPWRRFVQQLACLWV